MMMEVSALSTMMTEVNALIGKSSVTLISFDYDATDV